MKGLYFKFKLNLRSLVGRGGMHPVLLVAGLVGIGLVTFLSLRSSPALSTVSWLPRSIAHWADAHGRLCNFPAYGLLAVPFLLITSNLRWQMGMLAGLALLIVAFEIIQLDLLARSCDPADVAWGWAGLLTAWAGCAAVKKIAAGIRKANPAF